MPFLIPENLRSYQPKHLAKWREKSSLLSCSKWLEEVTNHCLELAPVEMILILEHLRPQINLLKFNERTPEIHLALILVVKISQILIITEQKEHSKSSKIPLKIYICMKTI